MRRSFFKGIVLVTVVTGAVPICARAQDQPESGPTIDARVQTFKRTGGVAVSARGDTMFEPGKPATFFLTAGNGSPGEMTVCGGGFGETGTTADKLARNSFVWELKVLPAKYENGSATFGLEWARYQADGGGRPSAEGKSTLTLREGERQTIDLVRAPEGARTCPDESAVVDIGTGYREARQFAGAVLQYDLWLTHHPASGEAIVRHFVAMAPQGADADFAFVPLAFQLPQLAPDQAAYDLFTSVRGTVRGRLLPSGRISLAVQTSRRDGLGARGTGANGSSGNSGRKLLEVAPDEAVEIELPAPGGRSSTVARASAVLRGAAPTREGPSAPQAAPKQAVSLENGRVVIDNSLFFEGQRTSLIVQVKQVRQ